MNTTYIAVGIALGIIWDNLALGIAIGVALSLLFNDKDDE